MANEASSGAGGQTGPSQEPASSPTQDDSTPPRPTPADLKLWQRILLGRFRDSHGQEAELFQEYIQDCTLASIIVS